MRPVTHRLVIDFCHDPKDAIGFIDRTAITPAGLMVYGSLVSTFAHDRAWDVIHKSSAGVPYQASLVMRPADLVCENVPKGATVTVNGAAVPGPVTVFRKWGLFGVSVLPYGSDGRTSVAVGKPRSSR